MGYTNSSLVNCVVKSPNHSGRRTHSIDRITPHCVVGQLTAEGIGSCFPAGREASCNYGIGKDGRVCLIVDEANRSWCSSSNANDQRAITIECASGMSEPYEMNSAVYEKLIALCVDICRRTGNTKKHRRGNGEGSVYQRKNGTWAAVLTVGVKPDGKPDRKFLYGKTRKEVADKLREAQNKLDAGVIPGGDNILFSTWVMNWLEIVIKPGIKERTYINYKASIEKHIIPGIGRYKLKDITDDVIQKYLNDQQEHGNLKLKINDDTGEAAPSHGPVAASSLIQQRRLIIAALEYAVDKGRINRNPGKKTRRPKSKPKTNNILTDEDMETLGTKGTKYRYYPAYMLTLTTACRRGEILGLDWQHVDIGIPWTTVDRYFPWGDIQKLPKWDTKALKTLLEDHNITIGDGYLRLVYQMVDDNATPFRDELKTDLSRRSLMITEEMVLILVFWRLIQNTEKKKATERGIEYNPDNLVFCTGKGTYIYPRNFTKMWSENLRSMGIDHKRFHDLRHTVATIMLEDGEAMTTVQEQLGHYDAGFTASRYGHVTAKMRSSAAVKLGERLEKVRNQEVEDEERDTVIPFQEGHKLKSAACKIK